MRCNETTLLVLPDHPHLAGESFVDDGDQRDDEESIHIVVPWMRLTECLEPAMNRFGLDIAQPRRHATLSIARQRDAETSPGQSVLYRM